MTECPSRVDPGRREDDRGLGGSVFVDDRREQVEMAGSKQGSVYAGYDSRSTRADVRENPELTKSGG